MIYFITLNEVLFSCCSNRRFVILFTCVCISLVASLSSVSGSKLETMLDQIEDPNNQTPETILNTITELTSLYAAEGPGFSATPDKNEYCKMRIAEDPFKITLKDEASISLVDDILKEVDKLSAEFDKLHEDIYHIDTPDKTVADVRKILLKFERFLFDSSTVDGQIKTIAWDAPMSSLIAGLYNHAAQRVTKLVSVLQVPFAAHDCQDPDFFVKLKYSLQPFVAEVEEIHPLIKELPPHMGVSSSIEKDLIEHPLPVPHLGKWSRDLEHGLMKLKRQLEEGHDKYTLAYGDLKVKQIQTVADLLHDATLKLIDSMKEVARFSRAVSEWTHAISKKILSDISILEHSSDIVHGNLYAGLSLGKSWVDFAADIAQELLYGHSPSLIKMPGVNSPQFTELEFPKDRKRKYCESVSDLDRLSSAIKDPFPTWNKVEPKFQAYQSFAQARKHSLVDEAQIATERTEPFSSNPEGIAKLLAFPEHNSSEVETSLIGENVICQVDNLLEKCSILLEEKDILGREVVSTLSKIERQIANVVTQMSVQRPEGLDCVPEDSQLDPLLSNSCLNVDTTNENVSHVAALRNALEIKDVTRKVIAAEKQFKEANERVVTAVSIGAKGAATIGDALNVDISAFKSELDTFSKRIPDILDSIKTEFGDSIALDSHLQVLKKVQDDVLVVRERKIKVANHALKACEKHAKHLLDVRDQTVSQVDKLRNSLASVSSFSENYSKRALDSCHRDTANLSKSYNDMIDHLKEELEKSKVSTERRKYVTDTFNSLADNYCSFIFKSAQIKQAVMADLLPHEIEIINKCRKLSPETEGAATILTGVNLPPTIADSPPAQEDLAKTFGEDPSATQVVEKNSQGPSQTSKADFSSHDVSNFNTDSATAGFPVSTASVTVETEPLSPVPIPNSVLSGLTELEQYKRTIAKDDNPYSLPLSNPQPNTDVSDVSSSLLLPAQIIRKDVDPAESVKSKKSFVNPLDPRPFYPENVKASVPFPDDKHDDKLIVIADNVRFGSGGIGDGSGAEQVLKDLGDSMGDIINMHPKANLGEPLSSLTKGVSLLPSTSTVDAKEATVLLMPSDGKLRVNMDESQKIDLSSEIVSELTNAKFDGDIFGVLPSKLEDLEKHLKAKKETLLNGDRNTQKNSFLACELRQKQFEFSYKEAFFASTKKLLISSEISARDAFEMKKNFYESTDSMDASLAIAAEVMEQVNQHKFDFEIKLGPVSAMLQDVIREMKAFRKLHESNGLKTLEDKEKIAADGAKIAQEAARLLKWLSDLEVEVVNQMKLLVDSINTSGLDALKSLLVVAKSVEEFNRLLLKHDQQCLDLNQWDHIHSGLKSEGICTPSFEADRANVELLSHRMDIPAIVTELMKESSSVNGFHCVNDAIHSYISQEKKEADGSKSFDVFVKNLAEVHKKGVYDYDNLIGHSTAVKTDVIIPHHHEDGTRFEDVPNPEVERILEARKRKEESKKNINAFQNKVTEATERPEKLSSFLDIKGHRF